MSYPTSIDSASDFLVAVNNVYTTLPNTLNSGDTTITVVSTTGFPTSGVISIDNEVIKYTSKSATQFIGCDRHYDGTGANSHNAGSTVDVRWVADYHNRLSAGVINIESVVGVDPQAAFADLTTRLANTLPVVLSRSALNEWGFSHTRDRILSIQLYEAYDDGGTTRHKNFKAEIIQTINIGGTSTVTITLPVGVTKTGYLIYA